jgi:hypothetical protein
MIKKSKNTSYIPDHHKMLRPQADHLNRVLDSVLCRPEDRRLFVHLVTSYKLQAYRHPDGVPVPYETIKRFLPGSNAFRLKDIVEISDYWNGHCRGYRPMDWFMREHLAISARMTAREIMDTDFVDCVSYRKMNKPPESKMVDSNRHLYPPLIRNCIEKLRANRSQLMLDDLERHYQSLQTDVLSRGESVELNMERRFRNNTSCREYLLQYPMRDEGGGRYSYTPAHITWNTGRLYIPGGCLLSASRDMKRAACINLPGFKNFDAKSCQVFIAMRLVEDAGIDARPLIDYLGKDDPKAFYGEALGIPGEDAKQIVIALCMGAHLPKTAKDWSNRDNSILDILAKFSTDALELETLLRRTWDVLGPMAECLKKWHSYLLETYIPRHKVKGGKGFVLYNAVGMTLRLWELRLDHPRFRWVDVARVVAHLLQGYEQACIQEQIVLDDQCRVTSIEHDGFHINEGYPDMGLWANITAKHRLAGMKLEEKQL